MLKLLKESSMTKIKKEIPSWLIELIETIFINHPGKGRDAQVRGGHLSAVLKFLRRDALFSVLAKLKNDGVDITPTLALRLIQEWTGQGVDTKSLLKVFGQKGRAADEKSKDFEKVYEIAEKWRSLAIKERDAANDLYHRVVELVQSNPDRMVGKKRKPIAHQEPFSLD